MGLKRIWRDKSREQYRILENVNIGCQRRGSEEEGVREGEKKEEKGEMGGRRSERKTERKKREREGDRRGEDRRGKRRQNEGFYRTGDTRAFFVSHRK